MFVYSNSCGDSVYLAVILIHVMISYRSLTGLMPLRRVLKESLNDALAILLQCEWLAAG